MVSKGKKRTASAPAQGGPPAKKQEVEPAQEFPKLAEIADLIKSDASKDAGLLKNIAPLCKDVMASTESQLSPFCRPIPSDVMDMLDDDEEDEEGGPPMEQRVENVVAGLFGDSRDMIINELQGSVVPGQNDGDMLDMENLPDELKAALAKMGQDAEDSDDGEEGDDQSADGGETKCEGDDEEGDEDDDSEDPQEGEEGGMFQEIDPEKVQDFQCTGFFKRGDKEEDEKKVVGNVKAIIKALAPHSKNGKVYRYCYEAISFEGGDEEEEEGEGGEKEEPTAEEKEFKDKAVGRLKEFFGTILSDDKFVDHMVAGYVVMTENGNYLGVEAGAPMEEFKADFGDKEAEE